MPVAYPYHVHTIGSFCDAQTLTVAEAVIGVGFQVPLPISLSKIVMRLDPALTSTFSLAIYRFDDPYTGGTTVHLSKITESDTLEVTFGFQFATFNFPTEYTIRNDGVYLLRMYCSGACEALCTNLNGFGPSGSNFVLPTVAAHPNGFNLELASASDVFSPTFRLLSAVGYRLKLG